MTDLEPQDLDHDRISEEVRTRLAYRLDRLMSRMDVFLEDDPREFSASQLMAYLQAAKVLGSLYQVFQRPQDQAGTVPLERVERMLEAARVQAALDAVEAERVLVQERARMALESAQSKVREDLQGERERRSKGGS
jgi:hypothetical protein